MPVRRPPMIVVLRIAGAPALAAAGLLAVAAFRGGTIAVPILLLAAAGGVTGLTFLGFASNLAVLHDIRRRLAHGRDLDG